MYKIVIGKHVDSLIFLPLGLLVAFRSQKSDPRGVPEINRIAIGKHIDSLIFQPFWLPEPFRIQKLDPRGVPEMY